MIRNLTFFITIGICLSLFLSIPIEAKSLKEIKKDIIQESKAIKKIQKKKGSILSQIKENKSNIQNIQQYLKKLDSVGVNLNKSIVTSKKKIKKIQKKLISKERWIHKRIRFLFIYQKQQFNSFFNIKKESNWIKSLLFIKKFVDTDKQIIKIINKQQQNYKKALTDFNLKKNANQNFKKLKSKEVKLYSKKIRSYQIKIKTLSTNEKNRINILEELRQFERKILEKQRKKSKFKFAIEQKTCNPLKDFRIFSKYGIQKHFQLKTKTQNLGAEIIGKSKQPVLAIAKGEVLYTGNIPGHGKGVIIYHGSDFYVIYGNLKNIKVRVGEKVSGCQSVARLPNSQRTSERTIYFEVRNNKNSVNPLTWLKKVI